MLADRQVELITEEAIKDFIYGLKHTNTELRLPAKIPGVTELATAVEKKLKSIILGRPFFKSIHQEDYTSASKFNRNLDDLVDDFTVFINELISQVYSLGRHFNATEYEFRKIEIQLQQMYHDIQGMLMCAKNTGGILYTVGDVFKDRVKIDNSRTTAQVDTKSGRVTIPDTITIKVNMDHYTGVKSPDNMVVDGTSDTLTTNFYNCLDNIEDSYYILNIKSPGNTNRLVFNIKLNKLGRPVQINEISISGNNTYSCELYYKNLYTTTWAKLGVPKGVDNNCRFAVDISSLNNKTIEANPGITEIQFILAKDKPDKVGSASNDFTYMIKEIGFYSTSNAKKSTLYSSSLLFEDWSGGKFTVKQVSLDAAEEVPENCRVDYFVAPDPYASGTLVDVSNNPVKYDSTLVDDFEYRIGYVGASGVLYSQLRDLGITNWATWEPSWTPIIPISRSGGAVDSSGNIPGKLVDMGSYTVRDNVLTGWNNTVNDISWGLNTNGIHYYNIYTLPDEPKSVTLRQGRHTWVSTTEEFKAELQVETTGYFDTTSTTGEYTLMIGPAYSTGTGYIKSPGNVVNNSINSVTWVGSNIDDASKQLLTESNLPEYVADVNISYTGSAATMTKNPAATWSHPSMQVKLKYSYYELSAKKKFITYIYVPKNAAPYIKINKITELDRIVVENREGTDQNSIVYDGSDMGSNSNILIPDGWNQVTIYTNTGVTWTPTTNVVIPADIEYYAYLEPLSKVGINDLLYKTHRDDHSKMSVSPSGGEYALMVNDPCTGSGLLYYHDTLTNPATSGVIFANGNSVNQFYDLSYTTIGDTITNVLLRADLYSDGINTPSISEYTIRGGDKLVW